MKKKNKFKDVKYYLINVLVLATAVILFILRYRIEEVFFDITINRIVIILALVIIVHILKSIRLYISLYGNDIKFCLYLKEYCKVTPISMLFPFKIGEIFRIYCYGGIIGSFLKGLVIIVVDRFMDTIALITVNFLIIGLCGGKITFFMCALMLFCLLILIIYYMFPGIYRYWKKYLLKLDASASTLNLLKTIENLNRIYNEVSYVIKGRGLLMYCLSLIAWMAEIGGIVLLSSIYSQDVLDKNVMDYLSSALTGNQTIELKQVVFVSVILLVLIYIIIFISQKFYKRADR